MNTDTPKKVLSAEQKARKNELARLRRMKNKETPSLSAVPNLDGYKTDSDNAEEEEEVQVSSEHAETEEAEVTEVPEEDPEVARKREIADKRRASLALARSKIKPKSQITQEKDDEIQRMRDENQRLKEESRVATEKIKESRVLHRKKYVKERPKKTYAQHAQQQVQEPSLEYLTQETYAEQLQKRLREEMVQRVMMDTFM